MASALSFSISRASTVDALALKGSSSVDFVAAALSLTSGKKMSLALC
jgi:hypothetical protein